MPQAQSPCCKHNPHDLCCPLPPNPESSRIDITFLVPVGRDKLLRTLQYFSRFLAWYLYRTNRPQSSIAPFDAVKKQFSVTRKLMRVGKFVEHFKAAAVASDAKSLDPVLRYCAVGRQLGYAGYMVLDNATVVCGPLFWLQGGRRGGWESDQKSERGEKRWEQRGKG
jgi:hypothetical protein